MFKTLQNFFFKERKEPEKDPKPLLLSPPKIEENKEMRKVKTKFIPPLIEESLPKSKKKPQFFSKSQIELVNELVKLNVSKITAEDLVKHSSQQAIRKWIKGIHYTKTNNKAAYLVKAIKENW